MCVGNEIAIHSDVFLQNLVSGFWNKVWTLNYEASNTWILFHEFGEKALLLHLNPDILMDTENIQSWQKNEILISINQQ